jgi:hypothetical protein
MKARPEFSQDASLPVRDIGLRLLAAAAFAAWFWLVYFGCDYLASGFGHRFSVHMAIDDWLPFLPQLAPAYLAINPLLLLPLVAIRQTVDLLALCATMAIEVAIAALVFLVFPVEPAFAPAGHGSSWLNAADFVNLTYNGLPSLHVALAVSVGMATQREFRPPARAILWAAVLVIVASTLLTRQHFVADAAAGAALAGLSMAFIRPPLQRRIALSLE